MEANIMLKISDDLTQCSYGDDSNSLDDPLRPVPDSASNRAPDSVGPIISDAPDVPSNLESPKHLFIRENPW